jgi:hypothetical protein
VEDGEIFTILKRLTERMLEQEEANDVQQLNDVEMQQPLVVSTTDSDYYSETEGDSPIDNEEEDNYPSDSVVCSVYDDWIELDLSMDSLRSLGFLSGKVLSTLFRTAVS